MQSKYGTKSSTKWEGRVGNIDKLNLSVIMDREKEWGFPIILSQEFTPKDMLLYKTEVKRGKAKKGSCIHFFSDDYVFESLWNSPIKTFSVIKRVGMAISPDFSVYTDMPKVAQLWNIYRSRWLGRFWQDRGIKVIPSVTWGGRDTFDFCFKGLPKKSTVALSTVGILKSERKDFIIGFEEMLKQLEPTKLLWVGAKRSPCDFDSYLPNVRYKPFWEKRADKIKAKQGE